MIPRLRAALPLLLTMVGFVGIGALWARRLLALGWGTPGALCAAAMALYAAWLGWESRVSAREVTRTDVDRDRGTMEFAAMAKVTLLIACLLPDSTPEPLLGCIGLAAMLVGVGVRVSAIRALGAAYGHRIRMPSLPIVTRGPYRFVRHPAYLGTLLAHGGLALVLAGPWSIAALALAWVPAVFLRTIVEDRYLRQVPQYQDYAARVRARLLPGLY